MNVNIHRQGVHRLHAQRPEYRWLADQGARSAQRGPGRSWAPGNLDACLCRWECHEVVMTLGGMRYCAADGRWLSKASAKRTA